MIAHAGHRLTLEAIVAPRVSMPNEDQRHPGKRSGPLPDGTDGVHSPWPSHRQQTPQPGQLIRKSQVY